MPNKQKTTRVTQANRMDRAGDPDAPTFESAMAELDGIVTQLEEDTLTLDEALTFFERGISLLRTCDAHLNQVRGKITELLKGEDGAFAEKILGTSLESFLSKESEHD